MTSHVVGTDKKCITNTDFHDLPGAVSPLRRADVYPASLFTEGTLKFGTALGHQLRVRESARRQNHYLSLREYYLIENQ